MACRIALIVASDSWGGQEIHTLALTEALARRNHSCIIIELDKMLFAQHCPRLPAEVDLASIPRGPSNGPSLYRLIRKTGARKGVLSKAWTGVGNVGLDLVCWSAFRSRFITIEHVPPPPRSPRSSQRHLGGLVPGLGLWWYAQGLKLYQRSLFPRKIVGVSRAVATALVEDYWFPARKVRAIPNGVDIQRFAPDATARGKVRQSWGIPQDAIVFGALGRLVNFIKGHDVTIQAFDRLCDANPGLPLYCVLVGTGWDEADLRAQAAATSRPDRFRFPGPTEQPWEAHTGLDVFLMPSRFEGIGLALLEAMACGVPPVAMTAGGIQDVMTRPDIGWTAPAGDRDAFFRGMQAALDVGEEGRRNTGRRAREHVVRHFEAREQYGRLADLIERL